MIRTYSTITRNINNSYTQKNAGYAVYWKLTFQLWKMFFQASKKVSILQFISELFVMILKTPFWLFMKPAFQVFSVKTKMKGSCTWENDKLIKNSIKNQNISDLLAFHSCGIHPLSPMKNGKKLENNEL